MMCSCPGGLSAMVVGTLICVGPPSSPRPLPRHSPPPHQVRLFPNSKSISHSSPFLLMSAQIPPPLLRFRPLSTFPPPLLIVDPHSSTPSIASKIVQLHFYQIDAITLFLRGLLFGIDATGREESCFSFLRSSLNRKAQIFSHVAHRRNLACKFLPIKLAFLPTLAGWGLCRGKPIICFIREAHNHPAWRVVYHHHRLSSISTRLQHSHSLRHSRTLLAYRIRYLTIRLNSIASANICGDSIWICLDEFLAHVIYVSGDQYPNPFMSRAVYI